MIGPGGAHQVEGVFLVDELQMEDLAGGIVDVVHQRASRAASFEPIMRRAVELRQHAYAGPALAPGAVPSPMGAGFPQACQQHQPADRVCPEIYAAEFVELFLGEGGTEAVPAWIVQPAQGLPEQFLIEAIIGWLAA